MKSNMVAMLARIYCDEQITKLEIKISFGKYDVQAFKQIDINKLNDYKRLKKQLTAIENSNNPIEL